MNEVISAVSDVHVLNRAQRKALKRKARQREKKKALQEKSNNHIVNYDGSSADFESGNTASSVGGASHSDLNVAAVDVEYVQPDFLKLADLPAQMIDEFREIFESFNEKIKPREEQLQAEDSKVSSVDSANITSSTDEKPDQQEKHTKLSRRQRRLARRISIATLKQLVPHPEYVEIHDATAVDPFLLLSIKSCKGTVPIPRHWNQKRKYLQGKRGIEKPPFQLPDFIRNTGVIELRSADLERTEKQSLKASQRERLRPKMGQLEIDYHVLYEAFFKYQTKPEMTGFGELYCEGKEFEIKKSTFRPGHLSERLRKALGIPDGAPPPWLFKQQRFAGPPPSYPTMCIPGLNAPIPQGALYGFHPGGWGLAPVDANDQPLWGWADSVEEEVEYTTFDGRSVPIDKNFVWGAMEFEDDADEEEDDATDIPPPPPLEEPQRAVSPVAPVQIEAPATVSQYELRKFQNDQQPHMPLGYQELESFQVAASQDTSHVNLQRYKIKSDVGDDVSQIENLISTQDLQLPEQQIKEKYLKLYEDYKNKQMESTFIFPDPKTPSTSSTAQESKKKKKEKFKF